MENEALLPEDMIGVLQTNYGKEMLADPKTRIRFINHRPCARSPRSCMASRAR